MADVNGDSGLPAPETAGELAAVIAALDGLSPVEQARVIPELIRACQRVLGARRAAAMRAATEGPGGLSRSALAGELGINRKQVTEILGPQSRESLPPPLTTVTPQSNVSPVSRDQAEEQDMSKAKTTEDWIRDAYRLAGGKRGEFITLEDLRKWLPQSRTEQDRALDGMYQNQEINLVTTADQANLTRAQRDAGIVIGGANKTRVSIG